MNRCAGGVWAAGRAGSVTGVHLPVLLVALVMALVPAAARAQIRQTGVRAVEIHVPADTVLLAPEHLPITVRPFRRARLIATIAPASAPETVAWRNDTLSTGQATRIAWDLHGADGQWIAAGHYMLRVSARDSAGTAASTDLALEIVRLPADTEPLPTPLGPRDLLPETVQVRQTSPWAIFIGAAAGILPGLIGRRELIEDLRGDPRTWLVVGSVTAVGFVGIFAGHHPAYSAENATRNAELRMDYGRRLAAATEANARALEAARYWIHVEAAAP
jgi:hypothetical protein